MRVPRERVGDVVLIHHLQAASYLDVLRLFYPGKEVVRLSSQTRLRVRLESLTYNAFLSCRGNSICFDARITLHWPNETACAALEGSELGPISHDDRESRMEAKITSSSSGRNSR